MPNNYQCQELFDNCYWEWTDNYNMTGTKGYIVYKAKSSADKGLFSSNKPILSANYELADSHVFFPSSGGFNGTNLLNKDFYGYYWVDAVHPSSVSSSLCMNIGKKVGAYSRYLGFSIRAICEGTPTNQYIVAQTFKSTHLSILSKTPEAFTLDDESDLYSAILAYNGLDEDVKSLLTSEKFILDLLKDKMEDLRHL